MAYNPGILTEWPWTRLGHFKYVVVAPFAIHSTYLFIVNERGEKDLSYFLIFPYMLFRMLHNQLWISFSRYQTSKGSGRIIDKGLEFEQVDRERNWDDQIMLNALLLYIGRIKIKGGQMLPMWNLDGFVIRQCTRSCTRCSIKMLTAMHTVFNLSGLAIQCH